MTIYALFLSLAIILGALTLLPVFLKFLLTEDQVKEFLDNYSYRLKQIAPYIVVLSLIPLFNIVLRNLFEDFFYDVGIEITEMIYGVEGYVVALLQQYASPPLTTFMTFVYLFVYVFILALTVLVYLFDIDDDYFKQLIIAFALNYGIGLISYLVFIAYGPRVFIEHSVEALMYQAYPFIWEITNMVNTPSNVFPSLHTSMSVTVALFSLSTMEKYPKLPYIVVTSAILVIISTMYLGIHWATDVIAGTILGAISFYIAKNYQKINLINHKPKINQLLKIDQSK